MHPAFVLSGTRRMDGSIEFVCLSAAFLKDGVEVSQALPTPGSNEIGLSPEILNNFHPY